jgi:hypothetical protein
LHEQPALPLPYLGTAAIRLSSLGLVDLAAIAPAYMPGEVFLDLRYARVVRLIRLLRVLRMGRYSRTPRTFSSVVTGEGMGPGVIGSRCSLFGSFYVCVQTYGA